MEVTSIDGLVAHCESGRFTGILRMRAREGIGELWFLSGVADEVHFGVSTRDEAMDRMRSATDATYELVARLPHPAGGFKKRFPSKGSIVTATPVTLMRYCEQYALTCTLAVESGDVLVEARYELGDLVSVETTADDDGITAMLEAQEGTYEFTLPPVELPAGTPVLPPAPALAESIPPPSMPPESLGFRALLEAKPAVGRPASDEAAVKRKTVEIARQQKSGPKPAAAPKESEPAKTTPKPAAAAPRVEEKRAATPKPAIAAKESEPAKTTPKPAAAEKKEAKRAVPRPTSPSKPEEEEVKAVAAPAVEEKREDERATAPKEDQPAEASKPAPAPSETESAKKSRKEAAAEEEEAKVASASLEEERDDELAAAPEDDGPAEAPKPAAPPAKRSWSWAVVVVLLAAALGYLRWTHRI
jgi:hypothetical protein